MSREPSHALDQDEGEAPAFREDTGEPILRESWLLVSYRTPLFAAFRGLRGRGGLNPGDLLVRASRAMNSLRADRHGMAPVSGDSLRDGRLTLDVLADPLVSLEDLEEASSGGGADQPGRGAATGSTPAPIDSSLTPLLEALAACLEHALFMLDLEQLTAEYGLSGRGDDGEIAARLLELDETIWTDRAERERAAGPLMRLRPVAGQAWVFPIVVEQLFGLTVGLEPLGGSALSWIPIPGEEPGQREPGQREPALLERTLMVGPAVLRPEFRQRLVVHRARMADYERWNVHADFHMKLQDLASRLMPIYMQLELPPRWEIVESDLRERIEATEPARLEVNLIVAGI